MPGVPYCATGTQPSESTISLNSALLRGSPAAAWAVAIGGHRQLRGGLAAARKFSAPEIGDDHIVRRHQAFADDGGGSQDAVRIEADGNVSVRRGNETAAVNPPAGRANLATVLVLRLHRARRDGIRKHASGPPHHCEARSPAAGCSAVFRIQSRTWQTRSPVRHKIRALSERTLRG